MPHVIVIDDDLGTRETYGAILRLEGFDVTTSSTGREGLDLMRHGIFDFALVDLCLPDMSGIDVLRAVRETPTGVRCVIMTAFGSIGSAVDALKLGARDYVEKPLVDDDLLEIVRRHATAERSEDVTESVGEQHEPRPIDPRVVEALRIVKQRYSEPGLRLRTIARQLGLSVEHICRLLKRETRLTFQMHLHRTRVREAERLLTQTDLSVKEIAYWTGYATSTRLDHHFKRWRGVPPSVFRGSLRQQGRRPPVNLGDAVTREPDPTGRARRRARGRNGKLAAVWNCALLPSALLESYSHPV